MRSLVLLFILVWVVGNQLASQPAPRHLEQVAFDSNRGRLIVHGGVELRDKQWISPSNFFEFDFKSWRIIDHGLIGGRRGHAMVFDPHEKRTYLIGGVVNDSILHDVWVYDEKGITMMNVSCPVKDPVAVYDPHKKQILVYGDASSPDKEWVGGMQRRFELWSITGQGSTKISSNGPQLSGPSPMVFNAPTNNLEMLAWDDNKVIIWQWQNAWRKLVPDSGPPERSRYALAMDSNSNLFLFGGMDEQRNFLNDLWKWDGRKWTRIHFDGGPSPRASTHMITGNDGLLVYGGTSKDGLVNELWLLKNLKWERLY